jgi:hypothetical protein
MGKTPSEKLSNNGKLVDNDHVTPKSDKTEKNLRLFKSGAEWTGNAAGRPKGSRNKLSEDFLKALADDFSQNGRAAIVAVREEDPSKYLTIVAQVVPKDIDLTVKGSSAFERVWRMIGGEANDQPEGSDADAVH